MNSSSQSKRTDSIAFSQLALRPREAAKALGIGERKLWALTNSGELPHARIGRAVVYPVRELQEWLSDRVGKGAC
ncbi:MAG: helix-turn-helix domain-containing protein [Phycisphaerales bacterium]|nr:helix-turn-helix domain-containing protein [Phycisphaerales bacterium]